FSKVFFFFKQKTAYEIHNVADESKNSDSVLEFYKKVLKLRHTNQALLEGSYKAINEDDANVLSYLRTYKDQTVVVALNMSDSPQKLTLDLKRNGFASANSLCPLPSQPPRARKFPSN